MADPTRAALAERLTAYDIKRAALEQWMNGQADESEPQPNWEHEFLCAADALRAAAELLREPSDRAKDETHPHGQPGYALRSYCPCSDCVMARRAVDEMEGRVAPFAPTDEEVARELAAAWYCTSAPTIPQLAYAGDLVRAVRAAEARAKEGR